MKQQPDCDNCKHCPANWREQSQLPLCSHPQAILINDRPVWSLYAQHDGHCGKSLKHFEKR